MATVENFLRKKEILEPNDGVRFFSIYTNTCYDTGPSFTSDQYTHLRITDNRHDMNELRNSFINFEFQADIQFSAALTAATSDKDGGIEYAPSIQFFVGWKNASDLLKTLQIENSNIDTNYFQKECSIESFAMNCMKPNELKKMNKFSHTLYQDARTGQDGVCGAYITIAPGTNIDAYSVHTVKFNIVLPISDITCLQSFPDFPSIMGDLVLKFTVNKNSLVWCQCDPYEITKRNVIKNLELHPNRDVDTRYEHLGYERRFFQVGQKARCITNYGKDSLALGDLTISVAKLVCTKCTCDVYGYNIQQNVKQEIYNMFEEQFYIPSQEIEVVKFIEPYRGGSYHSNISQQIHNVTGFVVVVPDPGSQTCYLNPMLNNLQFICDGVGYPHKPFENTYNSRFYTTMMRAGDQENFFEADNDYKNSIFRKTGSRYKNTLSDISSFMITFQTERNCNGNYYDGLETENQKVSIELKFSSSDLEIDPEHPEKPQVWFIRDTYWTLDNKNGLKYHKSGTPSI